MDLLLLLRHACSSVSLGRYIYSALVAVQRIVINPSVCPRAYLWTAGLIAHNFVCRSPVAVARSSSGGMALCCVLPVLWMTSHLAVVGCMSMHGLSVAKYSAPCDVARPGRRLMSMNALFCVVVGGLVQFNFFVWLIFFFVNSALVTCVELIT